MMRDGRGEKQMKEKTLSGLNEGCYMGWDDLHNEGILCKNDDEEVTLDYDDDDDVIIMLLAKVNFD